MLKGVSFIVNLVNMVTGILSPSNGGTGVANTGTSTAILPAGAVSLGYLGIPINSQSGAYSTVLTDQGEAILHPTADNNPRTFTIDGSLAYPVGAAISFVNQINTVTVAIGTDAMTLAGTASTGNRTLAADGIATALKIATGQWIISGTGLT